MYFFLMQIRCRSFAKKVQSSIFLNTRVTLFTKVSLFQFSCCLNPRQIIIIVLNSSNISVALQFTPICSLYYENRDKSWILDTEQFVLCILGPFVIQTSVKFNSLNNETFLVKQVSHRNAKIISVTYHHYYTVHF